MEPTIRIAVVSDADVVLARMKGRALANDLGFSPMDVTLIATAISELARSIVSHARRGEVIVRPVYHARRRGLTMVARQEAGPDVHPALRPIPRAPAGPDVSRVQHLVDEFEMVRAVGGGTTITATKWLPDN